MTIETLPAPLAQAIAQRGYEELTPVQSAVIAEEARGRDLLVSAQTGSGKTVAFGLAMAMNLFSYWNSDKMVLRMHGARQVDRQSAPEFYAMIEELSQRAKAAEHERDEMLSTYHNYEFASAAFQIGIVLASAAVITGLAVPGFIASGLALVVGAAFMGFGLLAPHLLHLG